MNNRRTFCHWRLDSARRIQCAAGSQGRMVAEECADLLRVWVRRTIAVALALRTRDRGAVDGPAQLCALRPPDQHVPGMRALEENRRLGAQVRGWCSGAAGRQVGDVARAALISAAKCQAAIQRRHRVAEKREVVARPDRNEMRQLEGTDVTPPAAVLPPEVHGTVALR